MSPEQRRQVLVEIAREELQRLVYGEITCETDRARLAELASAAGVELDAVLPASGDPGHDPRTGVANPYAHQDSEATAHAEDTSGLVTEVPEGADELSDDPAGEAEFEELKVALFADVAEMLDTTSHQVQALMDACPTAAGLASALRRELLLARPRAAGRHALAA